MTHKPTELTDTELDVFLAEAKLPVLVDLWAPWCAPCRAMSPVIDRLARNTAGNLIVAKLDVEKYPSIMQRFGIRGIPTLLLFNKTQEPVRLTGAQSLARLNEWLMSNQVSVPAQALHVKQDEELEWSSFYDDDELLAFIAARVLRHARAGEIRLSHSRYWLDGEGTLAAAMVHNPGGPVFERITGLPAALGFLLERCEYLSEEQVDGLFKVLRAGKDYRLVPALFTQWWLSDAFFPWENHLRAPALVTLLARWQTLCTGRFAGRDTDPQAWNDISSQAASLLEGYQTPEYQLENYVATLLRHLSPLPAAADNALWSTITTHMNWAQYQIVQIQSGWSDEERATPLRRHHWFVAKERETPAGRLSPEEIAQLREEWYSLNTEFISIEDAYQQNLPQLVRPVITQLQTTLNRLLAAAPDF